MLGDSILEENAESTIEAINKLTKREKSKLLVQAVREKKPEMVELLVVKLGADVNAKDDDGNAALMIALNDNMEMAKLLVKLGADINTITDSRGRTTLLIAVYGRDLKLIESLVKLGADIDVKVGSKRRTVVMAAAMLSYPEVVELLVVKLGADIGKTDIYGKTALSHAVHIEIIKLLLLRATDENLEGSINNMHSNPESLPCILHQNNILSVDDNNLRKINLGEIIEKNIPDLIKAVKSKENEIGGLTGYETRLYIKQLMALANLAVFSIPNPIDKATIESVIKSAVANSAFINVFFGFYKRTDPNTTTKMCCLGFLMTLTKLGFFNISDSTITTDTTDTTETTETTETEENGAETIVPEIFKITFQDKESSTSITVSVEPEMEEYFFDILIRLNPEKSRLTVLAKNVIKENKPIYDKRSDLPEILQRYIEQKPSLQEIIEIIEKLRDNASASL